MTWRMRIGWLIIYTLAATAPAASDPPAARPSQSLPSYIESIWPLARKAGVTSKTFHDALDALTPDAEVLALTRKQPEYNSTVGEYLARAVSTARIAKGKQLLQKWAPVLDRIEARFGVDRTIILALWAVETEYGVAPGNKDVIRSLLSLAYAHFRDDFFRDELIQALIILQSEKLDRTAMLGSWAGAMGQPQFLPSSFQKYAVDFDGDGRRDIWKSVPDTLASIANYLKMNGWNSEAPWGLWVDLPAAYDLRLSRGSFPDWRKRGITGLGGAALPSNGEAVLFHPAGFPGPAFLMTSNFDVIKTYNNSDPYALAVVFLADALKGREPPKISWPNRRPLNRTERIELQRGLARLGYRVSNFQGWIDFDLRDAVKKIQFENKMTPDGEPGKDFLAIIRGKISAPAQ